MYKLFYIKMLSYTEIDGKHFFKHMATTSTPKSKEFFSYSRIFIGHRLPDSPTHRLSDSPNWEVVDSLTWLIGESFFDYKYLRKFEAKFGTARKVV